MNSVRVVCSAAVIALAGFVLYRLWIPVECSRAASRAEVQLHAVENQTDPIGTAIAARNALEILEPCAGDRSDVSVPIDLAIGYRLLNRHADAIAAYQSSLRLDRRPEIYLGLGLEQAAAGDRKSAAESLFRAASFDPRYLDFIDDGLLRNEVRTRVIATYGPDWIR